MEKRFALFLVLSAAILFGSLWTQQLFVKPRPRPEADAGAAADPNQPGSEAAGPKEVPTAEPPAPEKPDKLPPSPEKSEPVIETPVDEGPESTVPPQRVTLGSLAVSSPYRMLVTLNNQGAAVERIELAERNPSGGFRYRDLEAGGGYLGHLALTDEKDGTECTVRVVGPGTPAALASPSDSALAAGLQPGDVIRKYNGELLEGVEDFERRLQKSRAGETLELAVSRQGPQGAVEATFAITLTQHPLSIIRPELNRGADVPELDPFSFLVSLQSLGKKSVERGQDELPKLRSLRASRWEAKSLETADGEPAVEFRLRLEQAQLKALGGDGPLEFVKRYRLTKLPDEQQHNPSFAAYHLTFDLEVHNLGKTAQQLSYRLDGPTGLPTEGWWYSNKIHTRWFAAAGARDIVWNMPLTGHGLVGGPEVYSKVKEALEKDLDPAIPLFDDPRSQTVEYVGVDTQYFAVVAKPIVADNAAPPKFREAAAIQAGKGLIKDKNLSKIVDTTFRLRSDPQMLAPGQTLRHSYTIFAGPKLPALLSEYELGSCIEYGWFPWVAIPLSWILHAFEKLPFVNFGLAIILLTALVRGLMVPLSRKAARNAQMMQELAPEMKRIADKYKNDMEKYRAAQRELFSKHNYNPAGGCLLMFVQLPIFIGLYRSLSVDVALRQASLIPGMEWCSNLAGPDKLWLWKPYLFSALGDETGWLGPYLNLLPVITIVLFIVQQKMFMPPATDDQTRMQQQMMKYMMIFMGVLFFKVPGGLCVYFIASSIWGLAERKLLPPVGKAKPEPANTKPSLLQRLKEGVKERLNERIQAPKTQRPRSRRKGK